jgi:mono/diheme cytochrome c family protein
VGHNRWRLRVIHPTPSSVSLKGKRMVLKEIPTNPLRADKERGGAYRAGRQVYYKNCFFCHGDSLSGEDTTPRALTAAGQLQDAGPLPS